MAERLEYCCYWSRKFTDSTTVDCPDDICDPIAGMTEGFSFAYFKELFITSLLELARGGTGEVADATDAIDAGTPPSDSTSVTDSVIVEDPDAESKTSVEDAGELDPISKVDEAPKAPATKKVKRVMPEVDIAESVKDNTLLKIVTKQAKMLLDEMDSTEEVAREEAPRRLSRPTGIMRATAHFVPG